MRSSSRRDSPAAARAASRVSLAPLKEPQGEGVALGNDITVSLAGEGGGKSQAGTFVRLSCAPVS